MSDYPIIVYARGHARATSFGDACAQVRRYLEGLRALHGDFRYWQTLPRKPIGFTALADDWTDLDAHLRAIAQPDPGEAVGYTGLDENGKLTSSSRSPGFFTFNFYSSVADAAALMQDYARQDHIDLSLQVGDELGVTVHMSIPASASGVLTQAGVRRIVLLTAEVWQVELAEVFDLGFKERVHGQGSRSLLAAAWFNYLRHPLIPASLPGSLPCAVEKVAEDAVLFSLSGHRPTPDDMATLKRARALQGLFNLYHLNHDFLVFGWPDDPADQRYAQQISGAPPGRAYVVAFAAFDGYDSVRQVLLFACLFHGMEQYGTTITPWLRNDSDQLERLPIVAVARQQLAALDYVGASSPIEWHVGIETHASGIAMLLNDLAGISRRRLTVLYTPVRDHS